MPKVVLNPSFAAYQGKLGSIVYQEGREGTIARRYVVPNDPRTAAQVGTRTAFAQASEAYKNLTASETAAWRAYAQKITRRGRSGKPFHPAAMDVFVALASKFLQINSGSPIPLLPPRAAFSGDALIVRLVGVAGGVEFQSEGYNTGNTYTEFLLQLLQNGNRKPGPDNYRSYEFAQFDAGDPAFDIAVDPGWYAGATRFVSRDTGQMTPLTPLTPVQVV